MKIFVASFNRASDGAISKLLQKMKDDDIYTTDYDSADYILAVGDRIETFDFILKRFRENKKIIHLWAGEISQGTHDEVYRHSITLMSCIQLCTNFEASDRVINLCEAIDKEHNTYVVGNVMLDNMEIDESQIPDDWYNLVLYNPPTSLSLDDIITDLGTIKLLIGDSNYIWIEPNGDKYSEIIEEFVTHKNLPREQFLGLLKNCHYYITNSSNQYYEAQFLLKSEQIVSIGERNIERESKYSDMTIPFASDSIMKVFRSLK